MKIKAYASQEKEKIQVQFRVCAGKSFIGGCNQSADSSGSLSAFSASGCSIKFEDINQTRRGKSKEQCVNENHTGWLIVQLG